MFIFSASENMFYSKLDQSACENAGTWPVDAVDVDDSLFNEYTQTPPAGKIRGVDDEGMPVWIDSPPPTRDELIAAAEVRKSGLLAATSVTIAPIQDAVDLDIATDDEKKRYTEWRKYRVLLSRVDTTNAPDIVWPTPPKL